MRSRPTIFLAYVLAGLFTVFNVGLPIVLYVCPMMEAGNSACDCKDVANNQLAFDHQRSACCGTRVIAERNTIPFLAADKYKLTAPDFRSPLPTIAFVSVDGLQPSSVHYGSPNTSPPGLIAPIYILSSSLLI